MMPNPITEVRTTNATVCIDTCVICYGFVATEIDCGITCRFLRANFDPAINSVYQNQYSDTSWTASTVDLLHNHPDRHYKCGANTSIDSRMQSSGLT